MEGDEGFECEESTGNVQTMEIPSEWHWVWRGCCVYWKGT